MSSQPLDPSVRRHETSLLLGSWIPWSFVIILLTTRFWGRIIRRTLGADDWTALASSMGYTVCISLVTVLVHRNTFNHLVDIPVTSIGGMQKLLLIDQCFAMASLLLGKTSVGLLLIRILKGTGERWRQRFIYINIALYTCITITVIGSSFAQCDPPKALWHPELVAQGLATCPRVTLHVHLGMVHASFGAWMDISVALLPITFVYKMNKPLREKIGICCLLGLGIVAGTCAIITVQQFQNSFSAPDPTYDVYALSLWAGLELPLVLIGGCIPPSKPVFEKLIKGTPISKALSIGASNINSQNSSNPKGWFSKLQSRESNTRDSLPMHSNPGSSVDTLHEEPKNDSITVSKSFSIQHDSDTPKPSSSPFTPAV